MSATPLGKYRVSRLNGAEIFRVESLMLVRHWFGKPPTEEWRPLYQHCGYDCTEQIQFETYEKACHWIDQKQAQLEREAAKRRDEWSPVPCNLPH